MCIGSDHIGDAQDCEEGHARFVTGPCYGEGFQVFDGPIFGELSGQLRVRSDRTCRQHTMGREANPSE